MKEVFKQKKNIFFQSQVLNKESTKKLPVLFSLLTQCNNRVSI